MVFKFFRKTVSKTTKKPKKKAVRVVVGVHHGGGDF
jgi:hypothetical protein